MTDKPKLTQEIVDYLMGQDFTYTSSESFSDGESELNLSIRKIEYLHHGILWKDGVTSEIFGNPGEMSLEEARKVYKERLAERIKKMQEEIEE